MRNYTKEQKAAAVLQMLPPTNRQPQDISKELNISAKTAYNWLNKSRKRIATATLSDIHSENFKLMVIIETEGFSEPEIILYCREKNIFPEQIKSWKKICLQSLTQIENIQRQHQEKDKIIAKLELELSTKNSALAEIAMKGIFKK